jgi:hypothetical protein
MQPYYRIYYSKMFRAAHRSSSGALNFIFILWLYTHVATGRCPGWVGNTFWNNKFYYKFASCWLFRLIWLITLVSRVLSIVCTCQSLKFSYSVQFVKGYVYSFSKPNLKTAFMSDSSVGIATRYGQDGPVIKSRCRRDFPHPSRPALGPTQPLIQWIPVLSRG